MKEQKQNSRRELPAEFYAGGFIDVSELKDTKPALLSKLEGFQ